VKPLAPSVARVHVGRQPLFDDARVVRAYELLFRSQAASTAAGGDPGDAATTTVILNTFTAFGLEALVGDGRAFVNLTRPFIVGELPVPFAPTNAVLELLETVPVDDDVVAGVRRLRSAGFAVALDDFLWSQQDRLRLLGEVDVVKVDISQVPHGELADTVERLRAHDVELVAERVEDAEDLERCRALGFELFQGYHLLRPETLSATALNPDRLAGLELLRRLAEPDLSMLDIERLVQRDAALTYRVLAATNAAATGSRRRLESVRDALVMLGTQRLQAWVMLLVASDAGAGREAQLTAAVTRARTCELLAPARGVRPDVAFTAGLVSRLDIVLGVGTGELLELLHLSDELHRALVEGAGPLGELLTAVRHCEGDGSPVGPGLVGEDVAAACVAAMAWATAAVPEPTVPRGPHGPRVPGGRTMAG